MNDDQLSEFEDEARQVGRKSLPPEWRTEILDNALRDCEVRATAETGASLSEAIELMRRTTRRAMWGMAACFVVILVLIALLFRPRLEPRMGQSWMEVDSGRRVSASVREPEERTVSGPRGELRGRNENLADIPPPPQPPGRERAPVGPGEDAGPIEKAEGGFLYALNDEELEKLPASKVAKNELSRDMVELQFRNDSHSESFRPLKLPGGAPATTTLGQHADDSSWKTTSIAGGVFAGKAPTEGKIELDRLARREGISLSDASQTGGVTHDSFSSVVPTREDFEADDADFRTYSSGTRGWDQSNSGQAQGRPVSMRRVPIVTTAVNQTELSNNITEEVRYQIDAKDPVGDPETTREIGVSVAVTPTLLSDGTIRMKMRPRSAQVVGEIVGPSGNVYPRVSESMRESIARIPVGHSLVVGGFYGEVRSKDDNKVPLLGDIPVINLFFKDKAAKEPSNLLFVVTPTTINDRVVIDTKVLAVNSRTGERTGVDWSSSLGAAGVSFKAIDNLNSLFGVENPLQGVIGTAPAEGDDSIVLSPTQVEGVLNALANGGLVTQLSNPTLITEENEQATISLIDRVPIITTTINEAEVSPQVTKPAPVTLEEIEKNAGDEPWSTFSLNVSDVSFKLARAALDRGEWPAADQVRVEEFVNAFDYGDPAPSQQEKMACKLEQAAHPFLQQRNLLRVSMRTAALGRSADTPLRLTVLLDNSGSMDRSDRVESVKNAFHLLASQLTPRDQVTLIGFARTPRLLADRLAGDKVAELAKVVDSTPSEGGTNLELALELAIAKAKEQMVVGAQNRIILLTDGAANLGNAEPEDLAKLVESMRQQGIAFDACGVGAEGLNDDILESLTRKGDGRYYFLDRPEDADAGFARQIAGALRPAARNVKVQMHFNPNRVGRYKLYGFEKHLLKKEDFRDDRVDAAELAAEESGNAIYQVELLPEGRGEIGTVSVRFQDAESGEMIEWKWIIPYLARVPHLEDAAASLRLASGAALLGEKLKGSSIGESVEMARLAKLVNSLTSDFPSDARVQDLVQMANKARELSGE